MNMTPSELAKILADNGQIGIDATVTATGGDAAAQLQQERRMAQADSLRMEYGRVLYDFCEERGSPVVYEYRFHPRRKWRLDAWLPDYNIGIEIDGGTWSGGRHVRGGGFEADCDKLNAAALMGIYVLRFTADMVRDGRMAEALRQLAPF